MSIYTIKLLNKRGQDTNYGVFQDVPQFSITGDSWMNVWFSQFLPNGGNTDITITIENYAWVGTSESKPAPGVKIKTGMSLPATLGVEDQPGSTCKMEIVNDFPKITSIANEAALSNYSINTGTDFTMPNNRYLVGLGKVDAYGVVSPVASIAAINNAKIGIKPITKFYISENFNQQGQIVDYNAVSNEAATIDFSSGEGQGMTVALVTQEDNGEFVIKYFPSLAASEASK